VYITQRRDNKKKWILQVKLERGLIAIKAQREQSATVFSTWRNRSRRLCYFGVCVPLFFYKEQKEEATMVAREWGVKKRNPTIAFDGDRSAALIRKSIQALLSFPLLFFF